jgi:hypothetical protein
VEVLEVSAKPTSGSGVVGTSENSSSSSSSSTSTSSSSSSTVGSDKSDDISSSDSSDSSSSYSDSESDSDVSTNNNKEKYKDPPETDGGSNKKAVEALEEEAFDIIENIEAITEDKKHQAAIVVVYAVAGASEAEDCR